ncbi:MAG: bifunctional [glutamate--ammonia ligase]-adenylyl-L-tyrosine phosphorylase/[glutamate--ammonia-ligase] adenylyltransferase [Gammaproteobacteria bacterium]
MSPELRARVERALDALASVPEARTALSAAPSAIRESLPLVFAASDFVADSCVRDPQLVLDLLTSGELLESHASSDAARLDEQSDDAAFMRALRRWRRRAMVRIAWRDLAGWASLEETLGETTTFADAAIGTAVRHARRVLAARYGEPRSASGVVQPLVVVGMGKLGGGELNFSSDVDLVFLFPEHGETDGARPIANEEFFTRLGQTLNRLLATPTVDGFAFRVDMRLRPFGDSGPLVASFASFEDYLVRHGRDWERYAWIKARAVTAAERYAEIYSTAVRPFVYRRYLDFGVFESLREMKAMIEREVERRELADDVKLGPGGIREIEFIVQALQLVRAGQDHRLQSPSLLGVLPLLEGGRLLPSVAVADLRAAYVFLRRLENRLQMLADQQTHSVPADAATRERIALAMVASDWRSLAQDLARHRDRVSGHFKAVVLGPGAGDASAPVAIDLGRLWEGQTEAAALGEALRAAGFLEGDEMARLLIELRGASSVRRLDESGRRRLQALLPRLLSDIAGSAEPLPVLRRVLRVIEAIGGRSAYFSLLHESAPARRRLVMLCGHGDFLAAQIAAHPLLLDELIDERVLSDLPDRASFAAELALRMNGVHEDDPEHQVEALCRFQRAAIFRVAVADLTGRLALMRVSDRLTEIAELIVERAMQLAWQHITAQFGTPMCGEGAARRAVRICAVGYGKLGGLELGYKSDLDLVFLHDSGGGREETDGARPIDNQLYFLRFAQRVVHLLTVHSAAGRLYEVDVRLRPSGKGGLIVTNVAAFEEYQCREAWTWEHQALLHARAVAGAPELRAEFERVRLVTLMHHVRRETLREEVRNMRERMRRELAKSKPGEFDLKQDPGGIADIEFLAQYWALTWAKDAPPVATFSDTIRQLESVASANLVPQTTVDGLTDAYRGYRTRAHRLALEDRPAIVRSEEFVRERETVNRVWDATMAD